MKIFILMSDTDGTLRSTDFPNGKAVRTIEEAQFWVKNSNEGFTRSFKEIELITLEKE